MASTARGYTSSSFLIELDGKPAGYALDASGGQPVGRVVDEPANAAGRVKKHLEDVRPEPIVLRIGTGMAQAMYDWIEGVPDRKQKSHDGAVVFVDHNRRETARLSWTGGFITELLFPALDAAAKEQGVISLTIRPQSTSFAHTAAGAVQPSFSVSSQPKQFLPSNFRFSISGLPTFSSRVSKVEPIRVRQDVTVEDGTPTLGAVHVDNVEVTGREQWSSDLRTWFDDFVVAGNNSDRYERSVDVELLTLNLKATIFSLELSQVGIYSLTETRDEDGMSTLARIRAGLYAEGLAVTFDNTAIGEPATAPAPAPSPPAPSGGATEGMSAEGFLGSWREGLRLARPALTTEAIASRLERKVQAAPPTAELNAREDEGRRFGAVWASEIASLEELKGVTGLAGGEWTTLTLPAEHSLLWALERAGETADPDVTRLSDDPFIRGVVEGAASVRREIEGQLTEQS